MHVYIIKKYFLGLYPRTPFKREGEVRKGMKGIKAGREGGIRTGSKCG
jgi:hypothetical protein